MTDTNPSSDLRRMSSNEFLTFGQESKADPCTLYQQYQSLSADKAAPTSKNMDRCEGLPCFSGAHLAEKNTETDLPWQFGPGRPCDVDSQYILREEFSVSGLGDIANPKNSKKFSETEYEWQLIIDRKQTFESEWFSLNILEDNDLRNESVDTLNKEDGFGAETNLSSKSSLFSGSETVESSDAGTSKSSKLSGSLSTEINAAKSSHRDGALWRTADSKELAALVSEKKHRYLKNCDLPSSENSSWKGPLSGCDLIPSKDTRPLASSADNVLLASLHKEDPNQLESRRLPSSPLTAGSAGLMQSHGRSPIMSEPQAIPSSLPVHAEKR
ncbi:hypothetical protein KP509_35G060300 [Ceratopteris richardii]|nr:hypothetical protein KP509_35G060300 [Ceratopteris richardii]